MKGYDPTLLAEWQRREATTLVIVVRNPDADNTYQAWGKEFGNGILWAHDMDLGRADLTDQDEFDEWATTHGAVADEMHKLGWPEAAEHINSVIDQQHEELR